jgi:hypothetical protein
MYIQHGTYCMNAQLQKADTHVRHIKYGDLRTFDMNILQTGCVMLLTLCIL